MTGSGITGPTVSAVDPAGSVGPILEDTAALLQAFSRLRSLNISGAYSTCVRKFDYSNWLM
jgi:hypothetical protein